MDVLLITGILIGLLMGIVVDFFTGSNLRVKRFVSWLVYGGIFSILMSLYGSSIIYYLSGGNWRVRVNQPAVFDLPIIIFLGAIIIGFFAVFLFKMSQQRQ